MNIYGKRGRGRPPKYDWEKLSDGQPKVLVHGRDYQVATPSFRSAVYAYAARFGLDVKTMPITKGGREALIVQFGVK